MRKYLFILLSVLFLAACSGNKLVHENFKGDLEQVLEKTDAAYEENRELSEDEENLINKFTDKYILGWFDVEGERYEMSDIEKEITRNVRSLNLFTQHDEPLSSEETAYEQMRKEIDEYVVLNEVPEVLVGKHPTYERQEEIHPQFIKDTKEMISNINPLIDERDTIYQDEYDKLQKYIDTYGGDGFDIDGTHYLHNEESNEIYMVFWSIKYDIDEGALRTYSSDRFLELKAELK